MCRALQVDLNGVRVAIRFNRWENAHVFDDNYHRCCGHIGEHAPQCRVHLKRVRPDVPPPLRYPEEIATPRMRMCEELCEGLAPEIKANGGFLGIRKAVPRVCVAWVHKVAGCGVGACRFIPCVADRVGHPAAAEARHAHGI